MQARPAACLPCWHGRRPQPQAFYPADLHNALLSHCPIIAKTEVIAKTEASASDLNADPTAKTMGILNVDEALARAGGSKKLLCRVLDVFLDNLPTMRAKIETSVAHRNAVAIQQSTHTLKGSAFLIGAQAAGEASRKLEMIAKSGKLEGAGMALEYLDQELNRLTVAVMEFRGN